jgi:hypothetical protein
LGIRFLNTPLWQFEHLIKEEEIVKITVTCQPPVHSPESLWGRVIPVATIKFGRGFLIHTGMSLDEEREYKLLLDIIKRLGLVGYESLTKSQE